MPVLPQGPLSAYLGVRDSNATADREGIGLLAKLQANQEARKFREMQFAQGVEEGKERRALTRETRDLQLAQSKDLREQQLAAQRQATEANLTLRQGQLDMQNQFQTARIAAIADEAARKREQDAWQRQHSEALLGLKRDQEIFKHTQLQQGAGLSGEAAGKIAMADRAVIDIQEARDKLFDKDGKLNRQLIAEMNVPFTAGMPFRADARGAYSRLHNAVAAKLRIETGAAATESEVKGILDRFLPKVSDPDNVVKDRLDSLEQFMNTTINQTKGVRLDALESRKGKKPAAPATGVPAGVDPKVWAVMTPQEKALWK